MERPYNSSALAKQVAGKLKLNQKDEMCLYKELSQIPDGSVKDALNALSGTPGAGKGNTLNIRLTCPKCGNSGFTARDDGFECLACGEFVYTEDMCAEVVTVPGKQYVACIKDSCVRDAQYAKYEDADLIDDDAWIDAEEIPLFLKIIEADTEDEARRIAAEYASADEDVIELYPLRKPAPAIDKSLLEKAVAMADEQKALEDKIAQELYGCNYDELDEDDRDTVTYEALDRAENNDGD